LERRTYVNGKEVQRGGPGAIADSLITDLESEFDLMRLERYMADLAWKDYRLTQEIDALKTKAAPPEGAIEYVASTDPVRRWGRTLKVGGRIFLLQARRKRLAEERRRCSAVADDIRFGLRVTGVGVPQVLSTEDRQRG
jgi:hypothetical protein